MTRIVLVGAGSVEFTRNLLGDILSFEALRDAELVLHDIDGDRLSTAQRMAEWTAGALGATPSIVAHLDRRTALEGADFVIDTIQVGGARATQIDFDIPGRYGLQYTINDTINVGGVMRGLRTIPVVLGIAADMADVCPDALFLNYTNPMGMLVRAVDEAVEFPTVGLCHSVYWTVHRLAEYVGVPFEEVDALSGGVNHLAWILRLEHRGRDLYPDIEAFVDGGQGPRRRPRPRRPVPALRLVSHRVLGAPRRVQPVVHPQGPGRAVPRPDRRVPLARRPQPRRVRRDQADAGRRRAVRDRAQRRVRGGDHQRDRDRPAGPDRRQRDERRRGADREPRRRRLRGGPGAGRRPRRPPDPDRRPAAAVRRVHAPRRRLPGAHGPRRPRPGPRPRLPRRAHGPASSRPGSRSIRRGSSPTS